MYRMAGKKKSDGRLDLLRFRPPTPEPPSSPGSATSSEKPSVHQAAAPPSSIDIILAELNSRRIHRTRQELEWWCVSLSRDDFKILKSRIEGGVKYDYFPDISLFALRMASPLHEAILGQFLQHVLVQLSDISRGDDPLASDFARRIIPTGSSRFSGEDGEIHGPDGSFRHEDASDPGVVIEISYSQKRKFLSHLADDYIVGSNGCVRVVIGIDLEYRKNRGKEGRVLVWRPRKAENADGITYLEAAQVFEGTFRAEDGSPANEDQVLRIQLKEFGNKINCPGIEDVSGEITIPFSKLYAMAQQGDKSNEVVRLKRARNEIEQPGIAKRKRLRSPAEELRPEDEEVFQEQEKAAIRQLDDQDSDFSPSVSE